jgi:hypothetical protein
VIEKPGLACLQDETIWKDDAVIVREQDAGLADRIQAFHR